MQIRTFLAIGLAAAMMFSAPVWAAPSAADCAARADRAERSAGSTMGGAGRGALGGALFGVIVGDSGKSAGRGAALGGILGAIGQSSTRNDVYKSEYDRCMAGY